jgi:hypothetical protein
MRVLVSIAILSLLVIAGCTADTTPRLTFATHLSLSAGNETVVVGEVRNAGYIPLHSHGALGGVLQLHDERGALVACASVPQFTASMRPGDSDFPLNWRGQLEPGRYELTWGAPDYGGVRSSFVLVQADDGLRLQRGTTTKLPGTAAAISCGAAGF